MGQSLDIPRVIPEDWKRLDLIINKIKFKLGRQSSPTFASTTFTDLTASSLVGTNASKLLESVTIGTGLDYTRPTLSLSHLGIEALTDPGVDKILFWDDSATACKWLGVGNSIAITTTTIDTIQDIRTSATPTFNGLISTGVVQATDFAKTGWPTITGATFSFSYPTFTVTDGGSAYYYIDGVKYTLGGNKTVDITDTEGQWYIYFEGDTLTASQSIWSFRDEDKALVAIFYWDAANNEEIFLGWEAHTFHMDGSTHARLHYAGGARWEVGLLVTDAGSETVNVSAGDIWDEDLNIAITDGAGSALFEQVLSPAELPIYYLDGASNWRIYETTDKAGTTDVGYVDGSNDLKYNKLNGAWTNATVGLNNYVAYYVIATNEQTEPVALIMGQRVDNKLSDAKINNVFSSLTLTGLPFQEMVVLARLILKDTATYTLEEVLDLRVFNIKGNITSPLIPDHGGLAGLGDDDHPQYIKDSEFTQDSGVLVGTAAGTFQEEIGNTLRTSLGLAIGTDVQAYHANLAAIAAGIWTGAASITTLGTIATGTWQTTDVGIAYGGTGQSTAQLAINALSAVSGATNEHVLTKDTATGNAIFKVAAGGAPGGNDTEVQFNDSGSFGGDTALIWDKTNNRLGIGTAPSYTFHTVATITNQWATRIDITGSGAAALDIWAFGVDMEAGYTGSGQTITLIFNNYSVGTGVLAIQGGNANYGFFGTCRGVTTGDNVGGGAFAMNGNRNYGGLFYATTAKNSATNIGVIGLGLNTGTTPVQIGGYFGLENAQPTFESAALIADNGTQTSPIFLVRDNGTTVFSIVDGANVGIRIAVPLNDLDIRSPATNDYSVLTASNSDVSDWIGLYSGHSGSQTPSVYWDAGCTSLDFATSGTVIGGGGWNVKVSFLNDGGVKMLGLKSGVNQAGAGAAANELWVDTADQTIKLGV